MKWSLLSLIALLGVASAHGVSPVDYVRDVKPILADSCYRCHGSSQQKGGLRLDTAASAIEGGDHGPAIQPGDAGASLLLQVLRGAHAKVPQMPYKRPPLSAEQISLIERWVNQGAAAPGNEEPETGRHWAFVEPARLPPPPVKLESWPRNPIDHFILSRLEAEDISPAPEADRVTLIRRLSLDLTGLPPSLSDTDAFVSDPAPDAFERLVERLLASPHYGERWGRWWLDVARYADSNGYSIDAPRSVWKYRDWVINAFNRDLPFNQFTIEQLAGDLLPDATLDQQIATGFHRNTQINQEGGIDPDQFHVESVMDRVNTTGTAFLGLTVACAQCHDHKFDPISQREYYQLYAFFNNTEADGHGKGTPGALLEVPNELEAQEELQTELEETSADLDRYLNTHGSAIRDWEAALTDEQRSKLSSGVREAQKLGWDQRSLQQKRATYAAYRPDDPEFKARNGKLIRLERREAKPITTLVMRELPEPRESVVFIKGDFTRRGDIVGPGVPAVLHPLEPGARDHRLTRLDLARWIVAPQNPLTARVTVNRIWQHYFGAGLVTTENDFGTQGSPPTHPELLDWLACELTNPTHPASGNTPASWSLKHIHRLIVTSATYRQSSRVRPELAVADPSNKLLARQSRLRLDAEIVRDVALQASGLLNNAIGGPSVFPPQPDGVMTLGQSRREWKASRGSDRFRRGMYTFFWRATPHPSLTVFDAPDAFSACTRRIRSNTPLQALTLLNDEAYVEFARALATRVLAKEFDSEGARLDAAFRLCVSRSPSPVERSHLLALLDTERAALRTAPAATAATIAGVAAKDFDARELAAWTTVSRVLLNLDETITRE